MATQTDKQTVHVVVRGGANNFQQEVTAGKHHLVADEPTSVGGGDAGPDPYDYLLTALGVCTSMTIGFYARRNRVPLENITVSLSHSRIYAADCEECETKEGMLDRIDVEVELTGPLTPEQHAKLMQVAAKCPVHRTLTSEINIRLRAAEKPLARQKDCSHRPVAGHRRAWFLQDGPQGRRYSAISDPLLLQIVHVEPVIHDAVTRDVSLDVILHVFLEFVRQIAQAQVAFLVVPGNDLGARTFLRIFLNPRSDLIVGCTAGNQRTKVAVINLGKIQPALIERAIGMVFALPVHKHRAAFVHRARRQHITRQRGSGAAREFFFIAQITREQFHFFKVLMHAFLPFVVVWFTQLRAREFDAATFRSFAGEAATVLGFF